MKIVIMVLVGLPATGKTTLARNLTTNHRILSDFFFVHICYDDLMQESCLVTSEPKQWKECRQKILDDVRALLDSFVTKNIHLCPKAFHDVFACVVNSSKPVVLIIDDNMYYRSMRYSYFQLAKKYSAGFCQLYFDFPLDTALAMNAGRIGRSYVPEHVIKNIYSNLEPPSSSNNWEKFYFIIPSLVNFNDNLDNVRDLLLLALSNPELPFLAHETEVHDVNVIHILDVAIRKCVSCKIREIKPFLSVEELKSFSERLAKFKARIMSDLKGGAVTIPQELLDAPTEDVAVRFIEDLLKIIEKPIQE